MMTAVKKVPARKASAKTITVEGRDIAVKMPTAEQLMAWQSTLTAISEMQEATAEYEKIRTHVDRYYKIATGLFVDDVDKEWVQDGRLDGTISIEKDSVLGMVTAVLEVYKDEMPGEPANRVAKRAAARKKI